MRIIKHTLSAVFMANLCLAPAAYADKNAVKKVLKEMVPTLTNEDIKPSEISGIYEVIVGANMLYVSEDGKYLIQGRMFDLEGKKDLTEEKLSGARAVLINAVSKDDMIIFKAPEQRYAINVFTDIDCGYCRKLHSEIDQYLAEGITVQYLFYPRAGKGSGSYKKAVSVWCADDRKAALTAAKASKKAPPEKNCTNPVDKHLALGEELDVRGTPMMITAKGTVFPGYMPAKKLVQALRQEQ